MNGSTSSGESFFDKLPFYVLKQILNCLPEGEAARLGPVNRSWLAAANETVRASFTKLSKNISNELELLKTEIIMIPPTNELITARLPLLRSHFVIEMIRGEMQMIKAICRNILSHTSDSFCIGRLVEEYRKAYLKAKTRNLPPWNMNDEVTTSVLYRTKLFLDAKLQISDIGQLLGSRILDILDTIINKHYKVTFLYQPENNKCTIDAVYSLRDPQFLNRPPRLLEDGASTPSRDDVKRIMNFLINLVRINNRVTLREEQYYRELEFARRRTQDSIELEFGAGMLLIPRGRWLAKEPRSYYDILPNPSRKFDLVDGEMEITEIYKSDFFTDSPVFINRFVLGCRLMQGFQCAVKMTCHLMDAPLMVVACWERLKRLINSGNISSVIPDGKEFKKAVRRSESAFMSDDSTSDDKMVYCFNCTIDVTMQSNPTEIEVYTLEFEQP